MGLCKCPKRKVTNLFCFEHRVNVCEHCLVANHAKVGSSGERLSRALGGQVLASSKSMKNPTLDWKLHEGKDLVYFVHCYLSPALKTEFSTHYVLNKCLLNKQKDKSPL